MEVEVLFVDVDAADTFRGGAELPHDGHANLKSLTLGQSAAILYPVLRSKGNLQMVVFAVALVLGLAPDLGRRHHLLGKILARIEVQAADESGLSLIGYVVQGFAGSRLRCFDGDDCHAHSPFFSDSFRSFMFQWSHILTISACASAQRCTAAFSSGRSTLCVWWASLTIWFRLAP